MLDSISRKDALEIVNAMGGSREEMCCKKCNKIVVESGSRLCKECKKNIVM